jgi:hypothetical protein
MFEWYVMIYAKLFCFCIIYQIIVCHQVLAKEISMKDFKAHAETHYNRQELRKQLVYIANVPHWKEFQEKYGVVLAETLDGCVKGLKAAKARGKKYHVGWYKSSENGESLAPHGRVQDLFSELSVKATPVDGRSSHPSRKGRARLSRARRQQELQRQGITSLFVICQPTQLKL